jgi:hypothetical protein
VLEKKQLAYYIEFEISLLLAVEVIYGKASSHTVVVEKERRTN